MTTDSGHAFASLEALRSRVVAHRGRLLGDPEQALSSLRRLPAWVRAVEVDVRISADGVPVLMHDEDVGRTTNGSGRVARLTSAQIAQLTGAGGERVPTLAAYLRACAERDLSDVYVHLKVSRSAVVEAVVTEVRAARMVERCVLLFRRADRASTTHGCYPEMRLGLLNTTDRNLDRRLRLARDGVVWALLTPRGDERYLDHRHVVHAARTAGVRVGASTLRGAAAHRAAHTDGCDVVITDSVHLLDAATTRS